MIAAYNLLQVTTDRVLAEKDAEIERLKDLEKRMVAKFPMFIPKDSEFLADVKELLDTEPVEAIEPVAQSHPVDPDAGAKALHKHDQIGAGREWDELHPDTQTYYREAFVELFSGVTQHDPMLLRLVKMCRRLSMSDVSVADRDDWIELLIECSHIQTEEGDGRLRLEGSDERASSESLPSEDDTGRGEDGAVLRDDSGGNSGDSEGDSVSSPVPVAPIPERPWERAGDERIRLFTGQSVSGRNVVFTTSMPHKTSPLRDVVEKADVHITTLETMLTEANEKLAEVEKLRGEMSRQEIGYLAADERLAEILKEER